MEDGETNEGDTGGKESPDNSKETQTTPTPAEMVRKDTEELKAENDAYDKEKLRSEEIRADKARGGMSTAGQEKEQVNPDQAMADLLLAE